MNNNGFNTSRLTSLLVTKCFKTRLFVVTFLLLIILNWSFFMKNTKSSFNKDAILAPGSRHVAQQCLKGRSCSVELNCGNSIFYRFCFTFNLKPNHVTTTRETCKNYGKQLTEDKLHNLCNSSR